MNGRTASGPQAQISVIVPAYNARETIMATLRSARSLDGAEIIVVDDGSSDNTAELARQLANVVVTQPNAGASAARKRGLSEAKSRYVLFLDSDDEVVGSGVERSIAILDERPEVVVAAGRVLGRVPRGIERELPRASHVSNANELVQRGRGPWPPAAAVIRKDALLRAEAISPPELAPRFAEDYEMMIRLALVGDLLQHDEVSTRYRLYAGKSSTSIQRALEDKERIRAHYAEHLEIKIAPMSKSDLAGASRMRAARVEIANARWARAGIAVTIAVFASPRFMLSKLLRRLHRRSQ